MIILKKNNNTVVVQVLLTTLSVVFPIATVTFRAILAVP